MEQAFLTEFKRTWLISLIGCALGIAGVWVLVWNEGQAVSIARALDEALNAAVSLNNKGNVPLWEYEGDLVHVSGPLKIGEPLTEPEYGIEVLSVKLKRRVQMYQWVEEIIEPSQDDTAISRRDKEYYYNKEWKDKLIDSERFYFRSSHQNPKQFPMQTQVHISEHVKIGALDLGNEAKQRFGNYIEVTSDERPDRSDIKLHSGMYYHCLDVWNPEIGDIRIQFSYAGLEGDIYTVIGQQVKNEIHPFRTLHGHDVLLVFRGEYTIEEAFNKEHSQRKFEAWGYRAGGWFLLFIATTCLINLIQIILSRFSILRTVVAPDSPIAANLALSLSGALLVASVAWAIHRPVLGASLAAASASPFLYCAMTLYNAHQGNAYHRM